MRLFFLCVGLLYLVCSGYVYGQKNKPVRKTIEERYPNGYLMIQGNTLDGRKEGKFYYYNSDGRLQKVIQYKKDVEEGEQIIYHANGLIKSRTLYKKGKKNGLIEEFHVNGKRKSVSHWKEGKPWKKISVWFDNGMLDYTGQYDQGLPEKTWLYYDNLDASLRYTVNYEAGKLVSFKFADTVSKYKWRNITPEHFDVSVKFPNPVSDSAFDAFHKLSAYWTQYPFLQASEFEFYGLLKMDRAHFGHITLDTTFVQLEEQKLMGYAQQMLLLFGKRDPGMPDFSKDKVIFQKAKRLQRSNSFCYETDLFFVDHLVNCKVIFVPKGEDLYIVACFYPQSQTEIVAGYFLNSILVK